MHPFRRNRHDESPSKVRRETCTRSASRAVGGACRGKHAAIARGGGTAPDQRHPGTPEAGGMPAADAARGGPAGGSPCRDRAGSVAEEHLVVARAALRRGRLGGSASPRSVWTDHHTHLRLPL